MYEDTPFPKRETIEFDYHLSHDYLQFFNEILKFARKLVIPNQDAPKNTQVHHWTALGLLRGVMSSPAAGAKMLTTRRNKLETIKPSGLTAKDRTDVSNPVGDPEFGVTIDTTPTQVMEMEDWTTHQRRQLRSFGEQLSRIVGIDHDEKLCAAFIILEEWISEGFNPVVFCRYIETAHYVGKYLSKELRSKFPQLDMQVITSEDPDELRKQRIEGMAGDCPRVLVATDCLSQGINLQNLFSAVLHYDLPWNPNDLEQREGRVDRFGQKSSTVKVGLLYGSDNPIDGTVLNVLLRKVREIKQSTGINIPFPEDSQSVIDTITQALLLNPRRRIQKPQPSHQPSLFDLDDFEEVTEAKNNINRKIDEAVNHQKISGAFSPKTPLGRKRLRRTLRQWMRPLATPRQ